MSKVLIQELKAVFTELGVPNMIVSDGGPQYTSAEFKTSPSNGTLSTESHHQGIPSQMEWQKGADRL